MVPVESSHYPYRQFTTLFTCRFIYYVPFYYTMSVQARSDEAFSAASELMAREDLALWRQTGFKIKFYAGCVCVCVVSVLGRVFGGWFLSVSASSGCRGVYRARVISRL